MAAAAAAQQNPNPNPNPNQPQPWAGDQTQWRIVWTAPGEQDEELIRTGFGTAWAIAVAPARIENDPAWLMPDRAFVWDAFAADPAVQSLEVASHADGRITRLTRL
jgi:hypothetical protein